MAKEKDAKKRAEKKKLAKERKKAFLAERNELEKKALVAEPVIPAQDVEIEYVAESGFDESDPKFEEWNRIFKFFNEVKVEQTEEEPIDTVEGETIVEEKKKTDDDDDDDDEGKTDGQKLSKKKRKMLNQMSIAELKHQVKRPDVVEVWDVTSHDPKLLVHLKSYRNSVPVPHHWCQKRKYLQGKRGIEKGPFKLPDFIEDTGIARIRQAYMDKEQSKSLKQQQKDRMSAKTHKMDVDYQTLHDAFFKFQTKPKMTKFGEVYFEGKEYEVDLKERRPGHLSDALKSALGMPDSGTPCAPPWLINMQRYGPPPSYPNLRIPGLNAPLPSGAQFGYHPGGWGKPPVDELGRLLYGDVFAQSVNDYEAEVEERNVDKNHWGELEEEEEEEEVVERGRGDTGEGEGEDGAIDASDVESGVSSVTSGLETPGSVDPRKKSGLETPESVDIRKPKQLYQVLETEETSVGTNLMGSSYRYLIPGDKEEKSIRKDKNRVDLMKSQKTADVVLNIDPNELENVDEAMIKEKYEQNLASNKPFGEHEDVSDVMEEESKKRNKKRGGPKDSTSKKTKWF